MTTIPRLLVVWSLLLCGACGRTGIIGDDGLPGSGRPDSDGGQSTRVDLSTAPVVDLAEPVQPRVDLSEPMPMGKSCGEILFCAVQCGFTDPQCLQMCGQDASPEALQQAGQLGICAFTNCLGGIGGGGGGGGGINPVQLISCLTQKCPTQLSNCDGLPF
jgi:hypothetical protein